MSWAPMGTGHHKQVNTRRQHRESARIKGRRFLTAYGNNR